MYYEDHHHQHEAVKLIPKVAYDDRHDKPRPAVMVIHSFEGRNELACEYARKLAELGYVGVAIDMYGEGFVSDDFDECVARYLNLANHRAQLRERVVACYEYVKSLPVVDDKNVSAMGFCSGGLCVLELARSGANIKAAVCIHGVWAKSELPTKNIKAKVLCCHGYKDPQVPPDQLTAFAQEMDAAGAHWEVDYYGDAKHAFTDPDAAKLGPAKMGREYNKLAAERAWMSAVNLFAETFSGPTPNN